MRFFLFFLISFNSFSQYFDTISVPEKIKFVRHLQDKKQLGDALYLLNYFNSKSQIDSLQLLEVKLLLEMRREKDADTLIQKIGKAFADTSQLKCSFLLLKNHVALLTGKYEIREPVCANHPHHHELWRVQLLALTLLRNKMEDFDLAFNSGKCEHPVFSLVEFSFYVQKNEVRARRNKSGFAAGLMSAILPGSGKIYAGKPREAANSFLPVLFNAAQAAEGYYYKKLESPHLYFFSALGTVFYASNIYGSARAAKRKNQEFADKIKSNTEFEIAKLIKYY